MRSDRRDRIDCPGLRVEGAPVASPASTPPPSSGAIAAALREVLWKEAFEARRFARVLDRARLRLPQHEAVIDFLIDALSFEERAPTPDLPTAA